MSNRYYHYSSTTPSPPPLPVYDFRYLFLIEHHVVNKKKKHQTVGHLGSQEDILYNGLVSLCFATFELYFNFFRR
jgi:hypothetical protein